MLAVTGLRVELGGSTIVDSVDLRVAPGEWITIIGPNGAGKSTFVQQVQA